MLAKPETEGLQSPESLARRTRINLMLGSVADFCARLGLPIEVQQHISGELLKINEEDFCDVEAGLEHVVSLFEADAEGDEILRWPVPVDTELDASIASVRDALALGGAVGEELEFESRPPTPGDSSIFDEPPFALASGTVEPMQIVSDTSQTDVLDISYDRAPVLSDIVLGHVAPQEVKIDVVDGGFVVQMLGEDYEYADKTAVEIADTIYRRAGSPYPKPHRGRRIDPLDRLTKRVQGLKPAEIAATEGCTTTSVYKWLSTLKAGIKQRDLFRASDTRESSLEIIEPSIDTVSAESLAEDTAAASAQESIAQETNLDDEPTHVRMAYNWAAHLGLDESERAALISFFDPHSNAGLSPSKVGAIEFVRNSLMRGSMLRDDLEFTPAMSRHIRKMLGIYVRNDKPQLTEPCTLGRYLVEQQRKNPERKVREIEQGAYEAFAHALSMVAGRAVGESLEATEQENGAEEWEKYATDTLRALGTRLRLSPEEAFLLRQRARVNDGTEYKLTTSATKNVLMKVQAQMGQHDRGDFDNPEELKALRGFTRSVLDGPMDLEQIAELLELDSVHDAEKLVVRGMRVLV